MCVVHGFLARCIFVSPAGWFVWFVLILWWILRFISRDLLTLTFVIDEYVLLFLSALSFCAFRFFGSAWSCVWLLTVTSSCGDDDDQRLLRCDRLIGTQHTELDHGCLACVRGGQTATAKNLPRRQGAGARRDASKMRRRRCSYVGLRHWLCLSNTSRTGPNRPSYQRAVGFCFLFFLKFLRPLRVPTDHLTTEPYGPLVCMQQRNMQRQA